MAGYRQAQDSFVIDIDGIPHSVLKGAVLSENDPAVKHDMAHGGKLFAPLDLGEDKPSPKSAKADPPKAEPVKAEAKVSGKGGA